MSTTTTSKVEAYWAEFSARMEAEAACAWETLIAQTRSTGPARVAPVLVGAGVGVIVQTATYAEGTTDEEAINRTGEIASLVATADGRGVILEWHEGETDVETWVYYERWTEGRRVAHGYVDRTSRRIVQTG